MMNVTMIQKMTQNTENGKPMMNGVSLLAMENNGKTRSKNGMVKERQ